jgi:hypothetical protein
MGQENTRPLVAGGPLPPPPLLGRRIHRDSFGTLDATLDWRLVLAKAPGLRRAAILWFTASVLFLVAALVTYGGEGQIKWPLFAATAAMAAMGFSSLRRSRSDGV